jgi:hypothetical protein
MGASIQLWKNWKKRKRRKPVPVNVKYNVKPTCGHDGDGWGRLYTACMFCVCLRRICKIPRRERRDTARDPLKMFVSCFNHKVLQLLLLENEEVGCNACHN